MKKLNSRFRATLNYLKCYYRCLPALLTIMAGILSIPDSVNAQTITSSGANTYWWRGFATGDPGTASNWSTNDSATGTAASGPFTAAGVGIFNTSVSNNTSVVASSPSINVNVGGFIINNSNSTAIIASQYSVGLSGLTNGGTAYGIVANPGAGATLIAGIQPVFSQTWLNNGNGLMTISNGPGATGNGYGFLQPSQGGPVQPLVTLTLGGTGNILIKANVFDYAAANKLALTYSGTGTLFLATNNTYTGSTTISSGTLALTNTGTLGTTPSITLNAGATLDASAQTNFVLSTTNVLYVSGMGTNVGNTAATIKAGTNGTVNLGSRPIIMTYDGANPALYVSQGTLSVSNNAFVINTVSTLPLTNGTYAIARQASGNINTNAANAYTINGTVLSAGSTSSIFASNNVLWLKITNASTNAAPITGIAPTKFWWLGVNNADFATAASWSTSSNSVVSSGYPGTTAAQNNIGIFNYPATNSVTETVSVGNAAYTFGGLIINNTNKTTFLGAAGSTAAALTLNGLTNDLSGTLYGIMVNAFAGSASIGSTNATNNVAITVNRSQTWLNNGIGILSVSNSVTINTNLTLGAGNIYFGGNLNGKGSLVLNSLATTTLAASNSYTGGTTILMGTLALTGAGTLGNSGTVNIDDGGTLDASAATSPYFNLSISNTLMASGLGTGVGSTAATINGAVNGTVNLGSQPVTLTYDGSNPALYISQGQLLLFTNPFTINTVSSQPLANGMYAIMQQASGYIGAAGPFAVSGTAIPAGATTSIVASNNVLYLTINTSYSNGTYTNTSRSVASGVAITSGPTNSYNGGAQPNFYYIGATNGANAFNGSLLWANTDSPSATLVSANGTKNSVFIFDISATNNTPVMVTGDDTAIFIGSVAPAMAGLILNNSNSVTLNLSPATYGPATAVYGFTNASSSGGYGANPYGLVYGLVANPNAGSLTITNVNFNLISQNQIWVNNGTGAWNLYGSASSGNVSISANGVDNSRQNINQNLTLAGSGNIGIYGQIVDRLTGNNLSLTYNGAGTLFLGSSSNSYSLGTTISSGTVALTNGGTLGGGQLVIAAGATLDVSGLGSGVFSLLTTNKYVSAAPNGGNNLVVSGTGTSVGVTASTIIGAVNGTVNLGSQAITMTYDGSHPALYVPQGTLRLTGNAFTINTASGQPLTNGTYVIAQQGYGSISSGGGYTIYGTAVSVWATISITASNNFLLLNISNASGVVAGIASSGASYYYSGATAGLANGNNWYPANSTNGGPAGFAGGINSVGVFNITATNNVNEAINFGGISGLRSYGGLVFNNTGTTMATNIYTAPNGFSNGDGNTYGVVVNAGSGAVTIGSPGDSTLLGDSGNTISFLSQTWVNNSPALLTINAALQDGIQTAARYLTFAGSGNILAKGAITQAGPAYPLGLNYTGFGTLSLAGTNTYTLGTVVQSGTLALTNNGSLGTGGLYLGAGATLDVSGSTTNNFSLGASNALVVSSTSPTSFSTIKGKSGGTVSFGSQTVTMNYDGNDPALYISQGTLSLSNNAFIINTPGNIPLATNKTYILAQQGTGNINVSGNNFTAYGSAFSPGYTYSIYVVNNTLVLSFGLPYWDASGTNWQSTTNWSTLPSSTQPNPAAVPGIFDVPIFNITPSNNVAQTISLNGNVAIAGMVFNNSNSTAINGGNGAYSLSTANSGVTITAGGGSVTFGSTNASQAVTNLITASQTWLNNGTGTVSVINSLSSAGTNSATLTLAGTGNFNFSGFLTTNGTGILSLDYNGSSTLTLGSSNLFKGGLTVEQGLVQSTAATGVSVLNNVFGLAPTVQLGNVQNGSTSLSARISLANGLYTNGLVLNSATTGNLILGIQAGSTATWNGGVTGPNNLVFYESTTGTLNFSNAPINNTGSLTIAPNIADANAGPTTSSVNIYSAISTNVTAVLVTTNSPFGTNNLVLAGTNTYTGTTTIGGTLVLTNNASLASTNIVISAGGTFNVAGLSSTFALGTNQTLTGYGATGTIVGNANVSSGRVSLNYIVGTPTLNVSSGALTLSTNTVFTVNNTGGSALATGVYQLISTSDGVVGTLPSVMVTGSGIANSAIPVLRVIGNNLYLIVAGQPTAASLTVNVIVGANLNLPLANLATNWTDPNSSPVTLASVTTPSARGFAVSTNSGAISYVAASAGTDTITYAIIDGYGATNVGVINITAQVPTAAPGFTLASGGYLSPQTVSITNAEVGATIYYTTNGTTPTLSSLSGSSPILITLPAVTNGFVIQAFAINTGESASPIVSATYNTIATPAWANPTGGSWTNTVNWSNNVVANGVGVAVDFSQLHPATNPTLVTLDSTPTVGGLTFRDISGTNGWLLAAGSGLGLTLNNDTNAPFINVVNGNSTISAPVAGTNGLTKMGAGILTLTGTNSLSGSIVVSNGTLALSGNASLANSTNIVIAPGGTFDVTGLTSPFTLGTNQTLTAAGETGNLNGNVNVGSGQLVLNINSTNPAPALIFGSGTLTFTTNNPIQINNAGPAFPAGNYPLITTNTGGALAGSLPTFNITGNGLAAGLTNSIQIINGQLYLVVSPLPPVVQIMTIVATKGLNLKIALASVATNWSSASSSPVSFGTLSATSTNGVTLTKNATFILYGGKVSMIDQISYTVTDTNGLTTIGLINIVPNNLVTGQVNSLTVAGGTAAVNFAGIPGYTYNVQVSTNLTDWTTLSTTNAPTGGAFQFIDSNAPQPQAFYRLSWSGN